MVQSNVLNSAAVATQGSPNSAAEHINSVHINNVMKLLRDDARVQAFEFFKIIVDETVVDQDVPDIEEQEEEMEVEDIGSDLEADAAGRFEDMEAAVVDSALEIQIVETVEEADLPISQVSQSGDILETVVDPSEAQPGDREK